MQATEIIFFEFLNYNLSNIIDGDIDEISEALKMAVMAEKMQEGTDA